MRVVHFTNTFTPHVGGVARSIEQLVSVQQSARVVAPEYESFAPDDLVFRVPAVSSQGFAIPIAPEIILSPALTAWCIPVDVVHVHHPYLLGVVGQRLAQQLKVPCVFTYHTQYEHYVHYAGAAAIGGGGIIAAAKQFCESCTVVIAPSTDVKKQLRHRGVRRPIVVLPTGVDVSRFARGKGKPDAFVVGFVGRLAREKNLPLFLEAVKQVPAAVPLVVGDGPCRHMVDGPGALSGQDLVDAYHAMSVFCFPSQSETQGMVVTEALAAGVPCVAVDAPGARDVIVPGVNGFLCRPDPTEMAAAIVRARDLSPERCRASVAHLSLPAWGRQMEAVYGLARRLGPPPRRLPTLLDLLDRWTS